MDIASSHQDFQRRHAGIGSRILEGAANPHPGNLIRRKSGNIFTFKENLSVLG